MTTTDRPDASLRTPATDHQRYEVCVVGGGIAGLCAALSAARHGARTVLIQDRAVLGGNASSEVRMWICGAHGSDHKETGILEELQLENLYRNPGMSYAIWDTVLYEKARYQDNLTLLLSTAVVSLTMADQARIASVRAWHLTRQCWIEVSATLFADCSGDSILRYSGAAFRWGRESTAEFGEAHAPPSADRKTMGNSLLMQLRSCDPQDHVPFIAPEWAEVFGADHPRVAQAQPAGENFWWLEIGGEGDTIRDADAIRDELLRIAYGVWSSIKNHPDGRGHAWQLEWIGMLPGKRENVRYEGDHILTQNDIEECGIFPDLVAHGGWSMDDHHPAAFRHPGAPTIFHPAPSPYGIPYRCLYSRDIDNLFCAGRNISCTHLAMSSTRVMATCATLGQAVGTAAALAIRHAQSPRGILHHHLWELQNTLLDDDQWLPDRQRTLPPQMLGAALTATHGEVQLLSRGCDRRTASGHQAWSGPVGAQITISFPDEVALQRLRLVCDSQLHRAKRMPCSIPRPGHHESLPPCLLRDARIERWDEAGGGWREIACLRSNRRRLVQLALPGRARQVRLTILSTWGDAPCRLFSCEIGLADRREAHRIIDWPATKLAAATPA